MAMTTAPAAEVPTAEAPASDAAALEWEVEESKYVREYYHPLAIIGDFCDGEKGVLLFSHMSLTTTYFKNHRQKPPANS